MIENVDHFSISLTQNEIETIVIHLGRTPNSIEWKVIEALWSEHCSYKNSIHQISRLPRKSNSVLNSLGSNAGVIDIDDGLALSFKIESHNHPSAIEPFQGAATGVGGIVRDIIAMGMRPIALGNSLRFGDLISPSIQHSVREVVRGIGFYGNHLGVPTLAGEIQFHPDYETNPLVNVFACGIGAIANICETKLYPNSVLIYLGNPTSNDGIGGATMASHSFENEPVDLSHIQIANPFLGKKLMEACLQMVEEHLILGMQDLGAAGLCSASIEMAMASKMGIRIDLDKVLVKQKNLSHQDILLSETQERMIACVCPNHLERIQEICLKWEIPFSQIGETIENPYWIIKAESLKTDSICHLPVSLFSLRTALSENVENIENQMMDPFETHQKRSSAERSFIDWNKKILQWVQSPNLCSRKSVWSQFDHSVRGNTVFAPGFDCAIVCNNFLALSILSPGLPTPIFSVNFAILGFLIVTILF